MSGSAGGAAERAALRFILRFEEDEARGAVRPLSTYLEMFPQFEDRIAREYLELRREKEERTRELRAAEDADLIAGRYRIERELGRGGQGVVYLARDEKLNRPVALKVLQKSPWKHSEDALVRFRREAEVASRLDVPGICAIYDTGQRGDVTYIAMRYVEGETLAQKMAAAPQPTVQELASWDLSDTKTRPMPMMPEPAGPSSREEIFDLVAIVERVARSLHTAHEAGIIHRDIKPANLMIADDGEPVILDFGLAREEESEVHGLTHSGAILGTPAFMSPEQISGEARDVDRRTDVYSLGVVLYTCLTGRRPFIAPTQHALCTAILSADTADPRRLNPRISRDLGYVLSTAMEKEIERRYQTAEALADDLARVRRYEPVSAGPVSSFLRFRRWVQRRPALATAIFVSFLTLVTGLMFSLYFLGQRTTALREKAATLDRFERLADVKRLEDSVSAADDLWPRHPDRVDAMSAWLARADLLLARVPGHRAALEQLRTRALPYDAADRAADLEARKLEDPEPFQELLRRETKAERLRGELKGRLSARRRRVRADELEFLELEIAEIRQSLAGERKTFRFSDPKDDWRHQVLARLIDQGARLEKTRTSVEERREYAASIRARSFGDASEAWRRCVASVAADDCYGRMTLAPQTELVPIGKDSRSGLWEFWHIGSGDRPERDGPSGRLVMKPESGIVLVLVPGGKFFMGSQADDPGMPGYDPRSRTDERPREEVELDAFFLSKFEMTQGQWARFTGWNESYYRSGRRYLDRRFTGAHPVERVTWNASRETLRRLGLQLPTEAQWEYTCRAGSVTQFFWGDDAKQAATYGNLHDEVSFRNAHSSGRPGEAGIDDGHYAHAPVGSYEPNAWGIHDIQGNVREWCRDGYHPYVVPVEEGSGLRPGRGNFAVARGGTFQELSQFMRSAQRSGAPHDSKNSATGIRPSRRVEKP